jgi:hypothetical protein
MVAVDFAGRHHTRDFDEAGALKITFEWVIEKCGFLYARSCRIDGKTRLVGIGMESVLPAA